MERNPQILICDDDSLVHLAIKHSLKGRFDCRSAHNGDEALVIIKNQSIDILLLDIQMRTPDEGLRYISKFREADPDVAIVMISAMTDFNSVREAMRLGATDYVPKDFNPNDLIHTIELVLERKRLLLRRQQQDFEVNQSQKQHVMIGHSAQLAALRKTIERIRQSPANVVITGETGTGKEVVARQLRGSLPDGSLAPFNAVDSATIQNSTAESLLFGHEKGAFTGADRLMKGIFEEADGGIVYFDEIGNMPLDIQSKLLRVLQEKEVVRLGSSKVIKLDFRVVCATNRNLDEMVKAGLFKADLLQRLNVLPIHLPPLRERTEDIAELVKYFVNKHAPAPGALQFTEEALGVLRSYSWPGNIRELSNLVAFLLVMTESSEIDVADLPPKIRDAAKREFGAVSQGMDATESTAEGDRNFYKNVARLEKEILSREYTRLGGNVSKIALELGMDRSHLYTKLREYGLHSGRSKASDSH